MHSYTARPKPSCYSSKSNPRLHWLYCMSLYFCSSPDLRHRVGSKLLVARVYLFHFRKHQLDRSISLVKVYVFHEEGSPSYSVVSRTNYSKGKSFNFRFRALYRAHHSLTSFPLVYMCLRFREINIFEHTVYPLRVVTPLCVVTHTQPHVLSLHEHLPF